MKRRRLTLIAYGCACIAGCIARHSPLSGGILCFASGFASALLWVDAIVSDKEAK